MYCPCLKADVVFNSKGFNHVRFDGNGKERLIEKQMERLNLLPLVVPVIQQAKHVSEYRQSKNRNMEYWALQGLVGKNRICVRVVLTKKIHGNVIYFSVMRIK